MKAIDVIRMATQMSDRLTMELIEDMQDAPLTQPTSCGGNHPLWVLGHLALVEGDVPAVLFGEPNPIEDWRPLFGAGSECRGDGVAYPPFEDVLGAYRDLRARNAKMLEEIGEGGLDRPTKAPPKGLEEVFKTAGQTFLVVALHQMNHRGQVADSRRALGRQPVMTPGRRS